MRRVKHIISLAIVSIAISTFLFSCIGSAVAESDHRLNIVISKDAKSSVIDWLKSVDSMIDIDVVYAMPIDSMLDCIRCADAVIISGGNDIYPEWYMKSEYLPYCESFDRSRDTLEVAMIGYAMEHKIPILGICRGHQLLNVANGGDLIPDIESFLGLDESAHRQSGVKDSVHIIVPVADSWIEENYESDSGEYYVNSIHHQAVGRLADGFRVHAISPDGVIESIMLDDPAHFVLGVQWHPEYARNEFSSVVAQMLFSAARSYSHQRSGNGQ
ncbi:MAG: gamma-glutamyl-gamma-aminobutyrate hydrolase family protein [Rikenellaceae bacterium]